MLFLRTLICLAPVLAFNAGAAHAEGFASVGKTGPLTYSPVCAKASDAAAAKNAGASTKMRVAFVCSCCGWENWGGHNVCVHQCCN